MRRASTSWSLRTRRLRGRAYPALNNTGIARLCLKTNNIWKVYEDFKARGIEFLPERNKLPGTEVKIVCFKDPDGTFVELLEGDFRSE
jgi:glyoxylase I family protein